MLDAGEPVQEVELLLRPEQREMFLLSVNVREQRRQLAQHTDGCRPIIDAQPAAEPLRAVPWTGQRAPDDQLSLEGNVGI